jgi:hypothetical protein
MKKKQCNSSKYDAGFTAGGLMYGEFLALESIILGKGTAEMLAREENENSFIGVKTLGARKRVLQEIKRRYHSVSPEFWGQFYQWDMTHQKLALFFVCLKTYPLMFDIHWDLTLKKFKTDKTLESFNVTMLLDEIASKDEAVSRWTAKTLDKVNSRYRKILSDVQLLNKGKLQQPVNIQNTFWEYFKNANEAWFLEACFYTI